MSEPRYWFPFMMNWELDMLECALYENHDRVHRFVSGLGAGEPK